MSGSMEKPKAPAKVAAPGDEKLFKKGDLVLSVSEKTGLPRPKASAVVDAVLEIVAAQLTHGTEVRFGGFGAFIVAERKSVEFRWETFNALNHPNWGTPNITYTSSSIGQVGAGGMRTMQLAAKYQF